MNRVVSPCSAFAFAFAFAYRSMRIHTLLYSTYARCTWITVGTTWWLYYRCRVIWWYLPRERKFTFGGCLCGVVEQSRVLLTLTRYSTWRKPHDMPSGSVKSLTLSEICLFYLSSKASHHEPCRSMHACRGHMYVLSPTYLPTHHL